LALTSVLFAGNFYLFGIVREVSLDINEKTSIPSGGKIVDSFHVKYFALPAAVLVLSLILIGVFYSKLPEETGWIFQEDGLPQKWLNKGTLVLWATVIQVILLLAAVSVTSVTAWIFNRYGQLDKRGVNPQTVFTMMGNMIGMPQLIIFFAMLDIFSYNSYQIHVLPLWLNALLVLLAGGIIISIFFLRILLHIRRSNKE
jgi:hypothetical protein